MSRNRRAQKARSRPRGGDPLERVRRLAHNLWWTWEPEVQRLFAALDPVEWEATNHNPLQTLRRLGGAHRTHLAGNRAFLEQLERCEAMLDAYLKAPTWYGRAQARRRSRMLVAYFCSEFAIHESMPQYAGGLGVLAGDHLKAASDLGIPLVGVGLLYRSGYYEQRLRADGSTDVLYPNYDFSDWPLDDTGKTVEVPVGQRSLHARIWKLVVGRVALYLLDSDVRQNRPADRQVTRLLYGGDPENRLRQQLLLGVGGVRALQAVGVRPTVFHLNEGHAAFAGLERLRGLRRGRRSQEEAVETVRRSSVFTTHTPVPAGHDRYEPKLLMRCMGALTKEAGFDRKGLLGLGRENPGDSKEPFCMTVLALKLSQHCNGVAALHGDTSRRMWTRLYGVEDPDAVPIRHVTNGIHPRTWLAPPAEPLYDRYLRPRWTDVTPSSDWWKRADRIPPAELWALRTALRRRLVTFLRQRLAEQIERRIGPLDGLRAAYEAFRDDALTIGFARRFATYKRAPLIFRNRKRIAQILNDPDRPVQIVFAGKAHPRDEGGQEFARTVARFAGAPDFRGRVAILENYDMHIGRMLTSGCDVWLNNPVRPMEASGTSGMKPPLHGGLNLSILDGWWPEAYDGTNGWAIEGGSGSAKTQDQRDAGALYELLGREVVPLFYDRDAQGIPAGWVERMVSSMRTVCARFSAHRMLGDYTTDYYLPANG